MKTIVSRISVVLAFLLAGAARPGPAQAQLQKIQQTVFGMDCAPCAHAMEQSLGVMEGVETVSVSLNEGVAAIDLNETNGVVYADVRKVVSNGGFAAKKATLKARGTVRREEDQWILETPAGEQFVLKTDVKSDSENVDLQHLEPSRRATVTGRIPASPETGDKRWTLRVRSVRTAA
jgi:copper chaperone CopZ